MKARTEEEIAANLLPHAAEIVGAPGASLERADGTVIGDWGEPDDDSTKRVELEFGFGRLTVRTGPLTPFFGPEEPIFCGRSGH